MITIAQSTLWLELLAILISSIFYLLFSFRDKSYLYQKIARISFIIFTALTTITSIFLMYFFLTHDFRLEYVVQYSSRDLPLHFLISSFWAGQEGSFLLWVLLGAWLGTFLIYRTGKTESQVMTLYNLQLIFLTILLIKQSPFKVVPQAFSDGMGLNMLLQDPWMVIHPPVVFLGYAAFAIPYAFAMTSLWRREYKQWIDQALPWVSFAFVTLGAGIIIGGVWSYKVLGWGGYWGWDPVENASLLPWLASISLLHGMILQKSTGRLAKTNYFMAAFSFVLILYSTFLTRSGILANFSVHSFVELGITGWLVFFMAVFIVISLFFIILRAREIPVPPNKKEQHISLFSLEFGLIAAVVLMALSAVLTGLGTSAPLITRLMEKASKVSNDFYVNVNLPIAILTGLLLSYVPLLKWGKNNPTKLLPRLITGLVVAIITAVITLFKGYPGTEIFLMVLFAGFTVGVNLELMLKFFRKSFSASSSAITHLGVGLMFIGFVASSVYDKAERVALPQGEIKNVFNYGIKFIEPRFAQYEKGTRLYLPVEIHKNDKTIIGQPDIYVQPKGHGENDRFQHPFIMRGFMYDLYVSPEGYEAGSGSNNSKRIVIKKGEKVTFHNYEITFVEYDISGMGTDEEQGTISVGAELLVSYKGAKQVPIKPVYTVGGAAHTPHQRVKLPGDEEAYIMLVGINADHKTIELFYDGPGVEEISQPPTLYAEISIKPGMTILWLGVVLVLFGGCVAIYRRTRNQRS